MSHLPADFDDFIDAYLDGTLTDAHRESLEAALLASPDARARFWSLARTHGRIFEAVAQAKPAAASPKPDAEHHFRGRSVGISDAPSVPTTDAGVPMYRKGYEPQPFKLRPHHYALIAATLLAACGLAAYLLTTSVDPQPDPVDPNPPPTPVATLIQSTGDLTTPHGYPAEGDDYGRGEYTLATGTAEFMLTNSVNVKLRGDTRMYMRNDMNVALTRGSAEFVVPKDASGFTVHLPDGTRVVDLGTAFRVVTNPDGRSRVIVLEGEVKLVSGPEEQTLIAGQRARIANRMFSVSVSLDLVDLIAGGDGTTQQRNVVLDTTTAAFKPLDSPASELVADSTYRPMPEHTALDGVFTPDGARGAVQLDSAGHTFADFRNTQGKVWGLLHAGDSLLPSDSIDSNVIGGIDYAASPHALISMVPNRGITFDLQTIRGLHADMQPSTTVAHNDPAAWRGSGSVGRSLDGVVATRTTSAPARCRSASATRSQAAGDGSPARSAGSATPEVDRPFFRRLGRLGSHRSQERER